MPTSFHKSLDGVLTRQQRLNRISDLINRGCTNMSQIAGALGVSVATISLDVKCILRGMERQQRISRDRKRALRVDQLMAVAYESRNGFDRSCKDTQEHISAQKLCMQCGGMKVHIVTDDDSGLDTPVDCMVCSGTGFVTEKTVKRKRKKAGDPAFLRIAQVCIREAAKLEGLYPPKDDPGKQQDHRDAAVLIHNEINIADGGHNPFKLAPPEMVLEAKAAMARLTEAAREADEERRTIEVEAVRKDRNGDE